MQFHYTEKSARSKGYFGSAQRIAQKPDISPPHNRGICPYHVINLLQIRPHGFPDLQMPWAWVRPPTVFPAYNSAMSVRAWFLFVMLTVLGAACSSPAPTEISTPTDPALEWAVPPGFALERVVDGFHLVTAIAFVPEPGPAPGDVRLFVAELNGVIKVVTNDGQVHIFADEFTSLGGTEFVGEYGLGGLCLAPEEGYVFVTWSEFTKGKTRVNRMARFRSQPGVFGLASFGADMLAADFFNTIRVFGNHQIGACEIYDGALYVSVGDGTQGARSSDLQAFLGKILRFDLDFNPAPGNPYPLNDDPFDYSEFVWASGLRNPFALEILPGGRMFVGDNGLRMDRFIEIVAGGNYWYDGTDNSIGVNPIFAFFPANGPSGLEFVPPDYTTLPPEYRGQFYLASVGNSYWEGSEGFNVKPGILRLQVDLSTGRAAAAPDYLLHYAGESQGLVGLALGPDGLYFSPFLPENETGSGLYRLSYEPDRAHPTVIGTVVDTNVPALLGHLGCLGCHTLYGQQGNIGPSLDPYYLYDRLAARLNSAAYLETLDALDQTGDNSPEEREARRAVRAAQGDDRLRVWIREHLTLTGFDNPNSLMPNPDLSPVQVEIITDYLIRKPTVVQWVKQRILSVYPSPQHRDLIYAFVLGSLAGALGIWARPRVMRWRQGGWR
ncbi:MAG: PQQ-dependent sugar dehydrogenase [Chloroflexi bacterium]|nr:PQQ-dependent sugar dehydrogenase [Chloroflexota bacterium]